MDEPAARPLLDGLVAEYRRLYGDGTAVELSSRDAADLIPPRGLLLLVTEGPETLAGGGLVPLAEGVAEIKRMWTAPTRRGRGYARLVLAALESRAVDLGYRTLRLQTGARSAAALALYRSAGYRPAPPFGSYRDEPLAIGFEKQLVAAPVAEVA
jgi:GNAT superfamily N-acetyltransferase